MKVKTWIHYLSELRACLLRSLVFLAVIFIALLPFSNKFYQLLSFPLLKSLVGSSHLIATSLTAPLIAPMKVCFLVALLISIPFFLYQMGSFIAPALYPHERSKIWKWVIGSVLLFYLGLCFAYFVVFPILFRFLLKGLPSPIVMMPDVNQYFDFTLQLFLAFGIAFEVPIIIFCFVQGGFISIKNLIDKRPYFIVGAFVGAMLIGPPDVCSQCLLAIPLCLLFEIGILIAKGFSNATNETS